MTKTFLLHYGEIALKKGNRSLFENKLKRHILRQMSKIGPCRVQRLSGRLLLEFPAPPDKKSVCEGLQKIFGLVNFIPCYATEVSLENLKQDMAQRLENISFSSFAVRAKKCEPQFPLGSQFVNEQIGRFVKEKTGAKVDLENPATTIFIELLREKIFYGFEKIQGLGGLPSGISGKVAVLLSGGIDSPVAAFRMMKRGCEALFIHFYSAPFVKEESLDKAIALGEKLSEYQEGGKLISVPFGEIQRQIAARTEESFRVLLYRRMMLRIAEKLALEYGAQALVTGESLSQVASQTLSNLNTIEQAAGMPIFRPLIGMDKVEIIAEARKIGTFETSILPHDDCCSFLVPKHPKTSSRAEVLEAIEKDLNVDEWVRMGVKEIKIYEL